MFLLRYIYWHLDDNSVGHVKSVLDFWILRPIEYILFISSYWQIQLSSSRCHGRSLFSWYSISDVLHSKLLLMFPSFFTEIVQRMMACSVVVGGGTPLTSGIGTWPGASGMGALVILGCCCTGGIIGELPLAAVSFTPLPSPPGPSSPNLACWELPPLLSGWAGLNYGHAAAITSTDCPRAAAELREKVSSKGQTGRGRHERQVTRVRHKHGRAGDGKRRLQVRVRSSG